MLPPVKALHTPVLKEEVLTCLNPKPGDVIVDGTLGGCGHAKEVLERIGPSGLLIGLDQDAEAVERAMKDIGSRPNVRIIKSNFRYLEEVLSLQGVSQVNGILFDLGVSSDHLDTAERGFSFMKDGPLDMRMDRELPQSAYDFVNGLSQEDLAHVFWHYGEERKARYLAAKIAVRRKQTPFSTTSDLAEFIASCLGRGRGKIHPATRVFQALRISVNQELESLEEGLAAAVKCLAARGRLVVISFHSLEDRIVKRRMRDWAQKKTMTVLTKKVVMAGPGEVSINPRSRSAKLRAAEKGE